VQSLQAFVTSARHFTEEKSMGTQNQTPGSQTQQPGKQQPGMQDDQKSKRTAKDTATPPRSDDDVADEGNQGTREDATGSNSRNS
jgi:hypothetical protein